MVLACRCLILCLGLVYCSGQELPELPVANSTLKLSCFGWRLVGPELIISSDGAVLNGVAISDERMRTIRHVSNDLVISDDSSLMNLDLLKGIEYVGGNVEIRYNPALVDFSGLSGLQAIGGSLNIIGNRGVQQMAGFTNLTVIGKSLRVHHNAQLRTISAFESLGRVGQDLTIRGNSHLERMPSISRLRKVDGSLEVIYNEAMRSTDGLQQLEFIGGGAAFKDNDNVTNLTMCLNIQEISEKLDISYNGAMLEVYGFRSLFKIGSLAIISNPSLQTTSFRNLTSVLQSAEINYNTGLTQLDLPSLAVVGWDLKLLDNDNMSHIMLPSLRAVGDFICCRLSPGGELFKDADCHNTVRSWSQDPCIFQVSYNANLQKLSTSVESTAEVAIVANHQLREISMPNVTDIDGPLKVAFNLGLREISSFNSLRNVKGIDISENEELMDISGFQRLQTVSGDFQVSGNPALRDVSGLSSDMRVTGNLQISENDQLLGMSGVSDLPTVVGYAVLSFNCSENWVRPPSKANCIPCEAWHYAEDESCKMNYLYLTNVAFVSSLCFFTFVAVFMTMRQVMALDSIAWISGRVVLRTRERHFLLHGFWSCSFPVVIAGTGCDLLDQPSKPLRARAVSDTELEVIVTLEKSPGNPRRSMSSLQDMPLFTDVLQRPGDSVQNLMPMDVTVTSNSVYSVISGQGVAYIRSPWELLVCGICIPALAWLGLLVSALAGCLVFGVVWGVESEVLLPAAGYGSLSGAVVALVCRVFAVRRRFAYSQLRNAALREAELLANLEQALWRGDDAAVARIQEELVSARGWGTQRFHAVVHSVKQKQSHHAGVGVGYLLSADFAELAQTRSKMENPDFYDLKDAFFLCTDDMPIGSDRICPRDGKMGCAFVDMLDGRSRGECTHFLSWTWGYSLNLVRSAMTAWIDQSKIDPNNTFLYMCFFVNNQYRILLDQAGVGSMTTSLGEVFGEHLQRVGRMVALLDHWDKPAYLSRIWTIFEQYTAVMLEIEVTFILPETSGDGLLQEIRKGEEGIVRVRESLCNVDAEIACAWCPEDERQVKSLIEESIGFEKVNAKVQELMVAWVATMVKDYLGGLIVSGSRRLQRSGGQTQLLSSTTVGHRSSTRTTATVVSLQAIRTGSHVDGPVWTAYMHASGTTNVESF